jgi:hypothetical protein
MADKNPASIYETQLVSAIFEPLARILIERARPEPGEVHGSALGHRGPTRIENVPL